MTIPQGWIPDPLGVRLAQRAQMLCIWTARGKRRVGAFGREKLRSYMGSMGNLSVTQTLLDPQMQGLDPHPDQMEVA